MANAPTAALAELGIIGLYGPLSTAPLSNDDGNDGVDDAFADAFGAEPDGADALLAVAEAKAHANAAAAVLELRRAQDAEAQVMAAMKQAVVDDMQATLQGKQNKAAARVAAAQAEMEAARETVREAAVTKAKRDAMKANRRKKREMRLLLAAASSASAVAQQIEATEPLVTPRVKMQPVFVKRRGSIDTTKSSSASGVASGTTGSNSISNSTSKPAGTSKSRAAAAATAASAAGVLGGSTRRQSLRKMAAGMQSGAGIGSRSGSGSGTVAPFSTSSASATVARMGKAPKKSVHTDLSKPRMNAAAAARAIKSKESSTPFLKLHGSGGDSNSNGSAGGVGSSASGSGIGSGSGVSGGAGKPKSKKRASKSSSSNIQQDDTKVSLRKGAKPAITSSIRESAVSSPAVQTRRVSTKSRHLYTEQKVSLRKGGSGSPKTIARGNKKTKKKPAAKTGPKRGTSTAASASAATTSTATATFTAANPALDINTRKAASPPKRVVAPPRPPKRLSGSGAASVGASATGVAAARNAAKTTRPTSLTLLDPATDTFLRASGALFN